MRFAGAFGLLVGVASAALIAGHVVGLWELPRVRSAALDPTEIRVTYGRLLPADGVSPWEVDATESVMARFVERWSEATLGRSRIALVGVEVGGDIHIAFSHRRVIPDAAASYITSPGAHISFIEVYRPISPRIDVDEWATVLIHETAHVLGCCVGPGSRGRHLATCRQEIMCSSHGNARTFGTVELEQLGLAR